MKKLFTYLLVLTVALLAIPNSARAQAMYLHFFGGYDGGGSDVKMPSGTESDTWAYTFYTSDCTSQTVSLTPKLDWDGVHWLKAYDGEQYSGLTNGNSVKCYDASDNRNKYDVSITLPADWNTKNYAVTITATELDKTGKGAKFTVTWTQAPYVEKAITLRTDAYKRDNNVDWIGIRYNEFDSENNVYTWYLNTIDGFTADSRFKLELNKTWYGNGETVGSTFVTLGSGDNNCIPTIPTTTGNQVVRLEAKKVGTSWQARIVAGDGAHDYYWVSPQITNGEKWPSFKMVPSRNRYWDGNQVIGDGLMSTKYYTFTIKDDDLVRWKTKNAIQDSTKIQWYILRDDDKVVYRPKKDLAAGYKPHSGNKYDDDHPISGQLDSYVRYINFWNGSNYDGATAYKTSSAPYNTGSWSFSKGSAKAHTFNLNVDRGHVLYNYTTTGASDANGYKLAGNWDAGREVSINIGQAKTMDPYYYKNGKVSTSYVAESDSIVYKINVDRPATGWGGLYLDVLPASNADWDHAIRPLITLGNSLDGRALHGALTTRKDEQSLNPETSENYLGYTFSFNATTMTYRLEFHTPDATLKPGTMDGNLNFMNSTSETINVKFSNASDGIHTTATNYQIAFGNNADITLSDDTKYTAQSFKLRYDGTNIYKDDETTPLVSGKTVFVKIKGWDDDNNYGDVHTYQYTFYSPLTFEPKGGLFINSAKIKIQGGKKPYKWTVYKYETKKDEVSGDDVLDLHTVRSSGTFDGDYNDTDGNYRISTPGILVIEDKIGNKVISDEKNLFDFTYSTSENYDIKNNGSDYWNAAPGDRSIKLDPTWGITGGLSDETFVVDWAGNTPKKVPNNTELSQTITGLNAGKTYTVQAIVGGKGEGKKTVTLTLEGAETVTKTINLRNGGSENSADLSRQGSEITRTGRVEYIEPSNLTGMNKYDGADAGGWAKVEATVNASQAGWLTISLTGDEWFDLSQVTLLESANTTEGFRTTASATATSVDESTESNGFDFRARDIASGWKKNNAYSFFDRGKNRNAVIFANDRTVIAMNPDHLADVEQNEALKAVDRRHPFNVVGSDENDTKVGTAKALYLTDMGYGGNTTDYPGDADDPVDYDQTGNITGYSRSGYTFMPKFALKAQDVIFDRQLGGESYKKQTTILLPFEITVTELKKYYGNDVKVWKYNGYNLAKKTILFTEVKETETTEANVPYILTEANGKLDSRKLSSGDKSVKEVAVIQNAEQHTATSDGGFTGSYIYQDIPRTATINGTKLTHFAFNPATGKFQVIHKNGAAMKPFRAYFSVPVEIEENNNAPAFTVIFDDTTTGISESVQVDVEPTNVYTLGGILVARNGDLSRLPKGVYIVNGKKVIK